MSLFMKKFDIRWSDLDGNLHVANSAYLNFMSHTRMEYLMSHGFGAADIARTRIGPVLFYEDIQYYREVRSGEPVFVTMELKGMSRDGMFFEFVHNMYNKEGLHHNRTELMGAFIDLDTRKLTKLPEKLLNKVFEDLSKTEDFRWLTKEDTRRHGVAPQNRPELFS